MNSYVEYRQKLEDLTKLALLVSNREASDQLLKMLKSGYNVLKDINQELVTCRRLRRETPDFVNLKRKLDQYIKDIEYWLTIAQLTY